MPEPLLLSTRVVNACSTSPYEDGAVHLRGMEEHEINRASDKTASASGRQADEADER
jgi:hypothetical protein